MQEYRDCETWMWYNQAWRRMLDRIFRGHWRHVCVNQREFGSKHTGDHRCKCRKTWTPKSTGDHYEALV